jgi:nucleotide sugar dehydrogenase
MLVGICGLGFVGEAIYAFMNKFKHSSLNETNIIQDILVYDKYRQIGTLDTLLNADIIYLCIPTPYDEHLQSYNMDEIDNTLFLLAEHKYTGILLLKSTVLPNYCVNMNKQYPELRLVHNPEFLTARTAAEDFEQQKHIILGYTEQSQSAIQTVTDFYKTLFPSALLSINSTNESALAKLACNSFYATKVQFFTELYLLCDRLGVKFDTVKGLMLQNNWINPMHTLIPGPDGQLSFGGACLPKDISALNQYMAVYSSPNAVLNAVIQERNGMRH